MQRNKHPSLPPEAAPAAAAKSSNRLLRFDLQSLIILILVLKLVLDSGNTIKTTTNTSLHHEPQQGNTVTAAKTGVAKTPQTQQERLVPNICQAVASTSSTNASKEFNHIYENGGWADEKNGEKRSMRKQMNFTAFYDNAHWPPVLRHSASGHGSDLGYATEVSLRTITETMAAYEKAGSKIESMIDIPCGDVNWIFDSHWTDMIPLYLGLDVAEFPIQQNTLRFAHHRNKEFRVWDGIECPLPKYHEDGATTLRSFDLVHTRDVLQHLPLADGMRLVCHILESGAKLFVTTHFPQVKSNLNVRVGEMFSNNLYKEPFNFPEGAAKACYLTHPKLEMDETCVFELENQEWVTDFVKNKCQKPATAPVVQ